MALFRYKIIKPVISARALVGTLTGSLGQKAVNVSVKKILRDPALCVKSAHTKGKNMENEKLWRLELQDLNTNSICIPGKQISRQ